MKCTTSRLCPKYSWQSRPLQILGVDTEKGGSEAALTVHHTLLKDTVKLFRIHFLETLRDEETDPCGLGDGVSAVCGSHDHRREKDSAEVLYWKRAETQRNQTQGPEGPAYLQEMQEESK
ncbi:hypothetical protein JZ751_007778 [Albula glossodonta]|uniref:Uncharacterized protein n=1 Tax=Albula glossodonta TaxID=121402 RepID=A0A8T2NY17_9TELE|nr:hypothetical protein JZ751_007778 [Albula glossodonta]